MPRWVDRARVSTESKSWDQAIEDDAVGICPPLSSIVTPSGRETGSTALLLSFEHSSEARPETVEGSASLGRQTLLSFPMPWSAEESVIRSYLLRVGHCKSGDRSIELGRVARIAGQQRRISGSRMSFGQDFATEDRIFTQRATVELCRIDSRLVIGQLPDQIVVSAKPCIAEKGVGQRLQQLLALGHTPTLVTDGSRLMKVGRIARRQLPLHLNEKRIAGTIAKQQDHIITCADAARTDQFERHIDRAIPLERSTPAGAQRAGILSDRTNDIRRQPRRYVPRPVIGRGTARARLLRSSIFPDSASASHVGHPEGSHRAAGCVGGG
jgi:hypothetical protein